MISSEWEIVKAFNTAPGFKEWLEDRGIRVKKKREEIVERLREGEIIVLGVGKWRLRYESKYDVGIFYVERKK